MKFFIKTTITLCVLFVLNSCLNNTSSSSIITEDSINKDSLNVEDEIVDIDTIMFTLLSEDVPIIINSFPFIEDFYNITIDSVEYDFIVSNLKLTHKFDCFLAHRDSVVNSRIMKNYILSKVKHNDYPLKITNQANYKLTVFVPITNKKELLYGVTLKNKTTKQEYVFAFNFYAEHDNTKYMDIFLNPCTENGKTMVIRPVKNNKLIND